MFTPKPLAFLTLAEWRLRTELERSQSQSQSAIDNLQKHLTVLYRLAPGIPSEVREKIFTPFLTTKSRGSGLGRPTARRLIEAHHGQIVIDCPQSGGATIVVQLPMES